MTIDNERNKRQNFVQYYIRSALPKVSHVGINLVEVKQKPRLCSTWVILCGRAQGRSVLN